MSGRFEQRPKRLARRTERDKFERSVMPAAFICFPVSVAVFAAAAVAYLVHGEFPREIMVLGVAVLSVPVVLFAYRFVRGHFSKSLEEP